MAVRSVGKLLLVVVVVLGAASVSWGTEQRIRWDAFAATVNTQVITLGDVRATMEPALHRLQRTHAGEDLDARAEALFDETLGHLIERELLSEDYHRRDIPFPEAMVDAEIARVVNERFGGRFSAFLDAMAAERYTLDRYRARLRDEMKAMAIYQEEVSRRVFVSPGAVLREYETNRDAYAVPEQVRIRAIELRGGEPEERQARAEQVRTRLDAGESFADVARAVSDDRRADEGGDWGWRDVPDLHSEIETAVSDLSDGQVSGEVAITDRLFILKLEGRKPPRVRALSEVYSELEQRVRHQEEQRLRDRLLERLQRYHSVRILITNDAG